jgi:hypothetical protein
MCPFQIANGQVVFKSAQQLITTQANRHFRRLDADNDGELTLQELQGQSLIKDWGNSDAPSFVFDSSQKSIEIFNQIAKGDTLLKQANGEADPKAKATTISKADLSLFYRYSVEGHSSLGKVKLEDAIAGLTKVNTFTTSYQQEQREAMMQELLAQSLPALVKQLLDSGVLPPTEKNTPPADTPPPARQ